MKLQRTETTRTDDEGLCKSYRADNQRYGRYR